MNIDLTKFNKDELIEIIGEIIIPKEYYKDSDIRNISVIKVEGNIDRNLFIDIKVTGEMIVPDSRTLEDVKLELNFKKSENLDENGQYLKNNGNILDLTEYLWENVVLEIPIRVVKDENENFNLKGEGWELSNGQEKIDERLAPLRELLDTGKE